MVTSSPAPSPGIFILLAARVLRVVGAVVGGVDGGLVGGPEGGGLGAPDGNVGGGETLEPTLGVAEIETIAFRPVVSWTKYSLTSCTSRIRRIIWTA